MGICQVCGCKTDELDFVSCSIDGLEKNVCSFCNRQLNSISDNEISDVQLKWLKAIIEKDVPVRENDVQEALKNIFVKNGGKEDVSAPLDSKGTQSVAYNDANEKTRQIISSDKDKLLVELTQRIENLENELTLYKLKQRKKTIIEIFASIIVGLVTLIVFFSSDFYSTVQTFFG